MNSGITRQYLLSPAYNGLIALDPQDNTKVLPDLADSWDVSPDGTTYTFHINPNAKFHNGTPVTATDVKYTYDVKVKPPLGECCATGLTPDTYLSSVLSGIDTVDDKTVKFRLNRASNSFLAQLVAGAAGITLIVPADVAGSAKSMGNNVVGSGPFKLSNYTPGTSFSLVRNPDYFKPGLPYLDGIEIFILPDESTRAAAFRAGQIDVTPAAFEAISPEQATTISQQMQEQVSVIYNDALTMYGARTNQSKPPFDDPRVRRAVHLALDRQRGIETLAGGHAQVGTNVPRVPGLSRFGDALASEPGYRMPKDEDIATAKQLLDEAGYPAGPDGTRLSIVAITRGGAGWQDYTDAAVFFQQEMAKIGIDVKIDAVTQDLTATRYRANDWNVEVRFPASVYAGPTANVTGYIGQEAYGAYAKSEDRDNLYTQLDSERDPAKQKALVRQWEDLLLKDLIYVPWFWTDYPSALTNTVQNFKPGIGSYTNNRWESVWLAQ